MANHNRSENSVKLSGKRFTFFLVVGKIEKRANKWKIKTANARGKFENCFFFRGFIEKLEYT